MFVLVAFRAADELKEPVNAGSNWFLLVILVPHQCTRMIIALCKLSSYDHGTNMLLHN